MLIVKNIILIILFGISSYAGMLISKKYQNRVKELKKIKTNLNIFLTKIKLTYEPIPKIFEEIGNRDNTNINNIFKIASKNMENLPAGEAWLKALNEQNTNLKKEDIDVLKNLSNLLGMVDLEGQISEIELVDNFLDSQIIKAEEDNKKSSKMYKALGITVGLAIVIILI